MEGLNFLDPLFGLGGYVVENELLTFRKTDLQTSLAVDDIYLAGRWWRCLAQSVGLHQCMRHPGAKHLGWI